jgi:effector-binding domain-containing protein
MIETPYLTQSEAILTACIPLVVPSSDICTLMDPAIKELIATVTGQGVVPSGPLLSYHRHRPTDVFDFEISFPVPAPITPAGRVVNSSIPSLRIARTIYQGPYEGLGEAWGEFMDWIEANGHQPTENLWECYLVGPATTDDDTQFRTELNRPLVS